MYALLSLVELGAIYTIVGIFILTSSPLNGEAGKSIVRALGTAANGSMGFGDTALSAAKGAWNAKDLHTAKAKKEFDKADDHKAKRKAFEKQYSELSDEEKGKAPGKSLKDKAIEEGKQETIHLKKGLKHLGQSNAFGKNGETNARAGIKSKYNGDRGLKGFSQKYADKKLSKTLGIPKDATFTRAVSSQALPQNLTSKNISPIGNMLSSANQKNYSQAALQAASIPFSNQVVTLPVRE